MTGLIVAALAGLALGLAVIGHAVSEHGAGPVAWRWLSGQPWHGRPHTDAGWLRPATRVVHPLGRARRWHHWPRAWRAGIRSGCTLAALSAAWGLLADRGLTVRCLAALAALAASCGLLAAVLALRAWKHYRRWIRPLHVALAPPLGIPAATRPKSWLAVPRNFATDESAVIRVILPPEFRGNSEARKLVLETVQNKLALEDARATFRLTGTPVLEVSTSIPPPDRVTLASVRELISGLPETQPLIGLGRKAAAITADLENDSPHVLISAGSGGGKSVLARGLAAQGMRNGGVVLFLDVKRISHRWAKGMPNVRYCRSVAEIHNALIWCQGEIDQRNDIVDIHSDDDGNLPDHIDIGPRFWLVCEEMNATALRLAAYWRKIKTRDDPGVSPAIEALNDFLFMGRAVKMNAIGIAQMMTAKVLGGPEARENFATRCLARYTVNAWKMLCPQVWPVPRMSRHTGRWQIVTGDAAHETQALFLTPSEARDWGLSGTVADFPDMAVPEPRHSSPDARGQRERAVSATGVALVGERGDMPVGLAEACESGILSVRLAAVRSARARDSEFPPAIGRRGSELLYSSDDLVRWERNRPMATEESAS
jgi:hypothetical protein